MLDEITSQQFASLILVGIALLSSVIQAFRKRHPFDGYKARPYKLSLIISVFLGLLLFALNLFILSPWLWYLVLEMILPVIPLLISLTGDTNLQNTGRWKDSLICKIKKSLGLIAARKLSKDLCSSFFLAGQDNSNSLRWIYRLLFLFDWQINHFALRGCKYKRKENYPNGSSYYPCGYFDRVVALVKPFKDGWLLAIAPLSLFGQYLTDKATFAGYEWVAYTALVCGVVNLLRQLVIKK